MYFLAASAQFTEQIEERGVAALLRRRIAKTSRAF
jgi:hypothetical protein